MSLPKNTDAFSDQSAIIEVLTQQLEECREVVKDEEERVYKL